jgi:hypothetical protein
MLVLDGHTGREKARFAVLSVQLFHGREEMFC